MDSILSLTLTYASACLVSFVVNKCLIFSSNPKDIFLLPRYVGVQIIGYSINFFLLLVLSIGFRFAYRGFELLLIVIVFAELFLLCEYYVFRQGDKVVAS